MLLFFICVYLLINLAVGWWANRRIKSTNDFVLAGRRLPLPLAAAAMFATWFGAETVLGSSSEFTEHGLIGVMEDPFGAALCLLLAGLFYARPLYRLNILTFCDYFRIRFGPKAEFLSAFLMVPSYFGWVAAQLVAMGIILQLITGMPLWAGVILCTAAVVFYTYSGGMWAVSITDFIQTIVILFGIVFVTVVVVGEAGGIQAVVSNTPAGFFQFFPEKDAGKWMEYIAAWITIGLGSIPSQDVFQRTMSAKSSRVAVTASVTASAMYVVVGMAPLFLALAAKQLYPEICPEDTQLTLPLAVMRTGDLWIEVLFFGALLSAIMSTASGAILAPASVLGENILKRRFPHLDDAAMLRVIRVSVLAVAAVSAVMALSGSSIYELVAHSSAFTLVSLFVPLTAGLYWKRASGTAALASMIAGMVVWVPLEIAGVEFPSILPALGASFVAMVAVSFMRPDLMPENRSTLDG